MQVILRLGKLLGAGKEVPRGLIQEIARATGLERHCVSSLVRGEAKYVSLEALGKICEYGARKYGVDERTLAAELFAYAPDEFWKMIAQCKRLQFCLGKRHAPKWPGKDYVMASDSYLQGALLSQISEPSLRRVAEGRGADKDEVAMRAQHFLEPSLLLSPEGNRRRGNEGPPSQKQIEEARTLAANCRQQADSGLIAIGSIKVNTLVEVLCAEWFGAEPAVPEDSVADPRHRRVPLFVRYRDNDVQPRSCCGGTRLSKRYPTPQPGIYFEANGGEWKYSACDDKYRDAAFLMYTYRPDVHQVELACGGFSGEATAALATCLDRIVNGITPQYRSPTLRMAVYVVEFRFRRTKRERGTQNGNDECDFELFPVAESALARRLDLSTPTSPKYRTTSKTGAATVRRRRPRRARPK